MIAIGVRGDRTVEVGKRESQDAARTEHAAKFAENGHELRAGRSPQPQLSRMAYAMEPGSGSVLRHELEERGVLAARLPFLVEECEVLGIELLEPGVPIDVDQPVLAGARAE